VKFHQFTTSRDAAAEMTFVVAELLRIGQFFCLHILTISCFCKEAKKNKKLVGKDFLSYFLLSKSFWCWISCRRKVEPDFSVFYVNTIVIVGLSGTGFLIQCR